jgi:hypothetical protein
MLLEVLFATAALLMGGIEAAFIPADNGGVDYLVRVEPDLVNSSSPHALTSDVPADARDVRSVRIYVADAWPPSVERSVADAARRPRTQPMAVAAMARPSSIEPTTPAKPERPWGWLIGSLVALFLSLGANLYLGMLLGQMRARYLRDIEEDLEEDEA